MTATVVRATTFAFLMVYAAKGAETLHGLPSRALGLDRQRTHAMEPRR